MAVQKMGPIFAVALLFACLNVIAAEPPDTTYRPLVVTPLPAFDAKNPALKTRTVRLDARVVSEKPVAPSKASPQPVYLELFHDAKFNTTLQQSCSREGCSWVGTIANQPGSTVILMRKDATTIVGNIRDATGRTFQIAPQKTASGGSSSNGTHVIQRLTPQVFPDERSPTPVPKQDAAVPEQKADTTQAQRDDQISVVESDRPRPEAPHSSDEVAQLDVLVLYTQNAKRAIEGPSAQMKGGKTIKDEIRLAAELANQSFRNSNIRIVLNVVGIQQVKYAEATAEDPFAAALDSLGNVDGVLDSVFGLKERYNAHLVSLWIAEKPEVTPPTACGLAYQLETQTKSFGRYAFSVINAVCGLPNFSFAHELGHNLGAQHNREVESDPSNSAYNFGYIAPSRKFRCVMSYACDAVTNETPCVRQPIWSSPDQSWLGEKTGVAEGSEGAADNARRLNENRFLAADYWRSSSEGDPSQLEADAPPHASDRSSRPRKVH